MTGARQAAPQALTSDAWYTLLYLTTPERKELAGRRRRIWSEPFLRAGASRSHVGDLLARRDRWMREQEAEGRTPNVREQLDRLRSWSGARLDADALLAKLDRTLLRAKVRLAPGALAAVRSLDRAGVPLGVVSNVMNESGSAARGILDHLGLLPYFRVVVLSSEHPWAKPSPEPFRAASRFLGVSPERTVHIGDLAYDITGARAAGFSAWWYTGLRRLNGYLPAQVDPRTVARRDTIRSWDEVAARFGAR
jgi:HAD superfamily hydrolase (TIGR01509 family)